LGDVGKEKRRTSPSDRFDVCAAGKKKEKEEKMGKGDLTPYSEIPHRKEKKGERKRFPASAPEVF